jgi:carbonic anhydrase/acetyltransferase-like protein (isoleucine patch superfamily)
MTFLRAFVLAVWLWFLPATLAAAVVALLAAVPGGRWPWFVWVLLSPWLYFCWLTSFLLFCAVGIRRMGKRHPKPRRVVAGEPGLVTVIACTYRMRLIRSLPLVGLMQHLPWVRTLVMSGYSPSVHIGKGAQIAGHLWDPDLTEVGDFAVLGEGVTVSAHIMMIMPSGKHAYITAPVKIGNYAMVGTGSTVTAGCVIGEFAVILPHSFLAPHTKVGAGETWGGSPASFQRSRTRLQEAAPVNASQEA